MLAEQRRGALSLDSVEPAFTERMGVNFDGKRAIGCLAASLIPDGASAIIDCGTSALCLAGALMNHRRLTVYTNDIHVAALTRCFWKERVGCPD